METTLESKSRTDSPVSSDPGSRLSIRAVRQLALNRLDFRLSAEPDFVASCWAQIGALEEHPDLTVIYCSVRRLLRTYVLFEFVAGETLEELVKRSDPAACEHEIPLFCRILDAFEGSAKRPTGEPVPVADLEFIDFGVGRACAGLTSKFHGVMLVAPDGTTVDEVAGEYGGSRSQVFAAVMELCAKLPGDLPRTATFGPVSLRGVNTCSLAGSKVSPGKAPVPVASSPVKTGSSIRERSTSYLIALGTMLFTLLVLYGIGEFLSNRTQTPDATQLKLPAIALELPKSPVEDAAEKPPMPRPAAARRSNTPKKPVPSIIFAGGATPIHQTNLLYPVEAQNEHVSGLVEVQLTIAEDGSVKSPRVLSGDPLLRAGLTEELSKWLFQPLRVDGKPVPMTTELTIRFNLNP